MLAMMPMTLHPIRHHAAKSCTIRKLPICPLHGWNGPSRATVSKHAPNQSVFILVCRMLYWRGFRPSIFATPKRLSIPLSRGRRTTAFSSGRNGANPAGPFSGFISCRAPVPIAVGMS